MIDQPKAYSASLGSAETCAQGENQMGTREIQLYVLTVFGIVWLSTASVVQGEFPASPLNCGVEICIQLTKCFWIPSGFLDDPRHDRKHGAEDHNCRQQRHHIVGNRKNECVQCRIFSLAQVGSVAQHMSLNERPLWAVSGLSNVNFEISLLSVCFRPKADVQITIIFYITIMLLAKTRFSWCLRRN